MGALALIAAFYAIFRPAASAVALTWVLGIWLIVRGIFELVGAFASTVATPRWLLALGGVLSLLLGFLFTANPGTGAAGRVLARPDSTRLGRRHGGRGARREAPGTGQLPYPHRTGSRAPGLTRLGARHGGQGVGAAVDVWPAPSLAAGASSARSGHTPGRCRSAPG